MTMIEAVDVRRAFGDVVALHDVSLRVGRGELVGLLGPNGAGKSTLISLLTGLRRPDRGRVQLMGRDPRDPAARVVLGSTPQETGLPETLRVAEVVRFVSAHYPDPVPGADLLERFGLTGLERRQTGALSGGQKRRLAVALAFVGRPEVVLLDEPTTGLDVDARHALWDGIRDFHDTGGTVLLSSHYLEEVQTLAGRVVVLAGGRVVADDDTAAIRDVVGLRRVKVRAGDLPPLPGVTRAGRDGDSHDLLTRDSDTLVRSLVSSGVGFSDLEVAGTSLEEAFLALTTHPTTTGSEASR